MEITITEHAEKMLVNKLKEGEFLRVTVREGGCAGLTYAAEVDRVMAVGDQLVMERGRVKVVSDPVSSKYLDGLVVDYSDDLFKGGLKFSNVHTKSTCSCGSSFSLSGFPDIPGGKCQN